MHVGRGIAPALLLAVAVLASSVQRGAAEAHHNHDAPLTVEAPYALLPCDLALSAYPAVLEDPLEASVARLARAGGNGRFLRMAEGPLGRRWVESALDACRAPPV